MMSEGAFEGLRNIHEKSGRLVEKEAVIYGP